MLCRRQASPPLSSPARSPALSPMDNQTLSPKLSPRPSPTLSPKVSPSLSPRPSPTLSPELSPTSTVRRRVVFRCFFARRLRPRLLHDQTSSSAREIPTGFPISSTLRSPQLSPALSPEVSPKISPALSPMSIPATSHLTRGGQESLLAFPLLWCDCCVVLSVPNSHPMNPPSTMFRARNAVTLEREKENREYSSVLIARLASMPMRMA